MIVWVQLRATVHDSDRVARPQEDKKKRGAWKTWREKKKKTVAKHLRREGTIISRVPLNVRALSPPVIDVAPLSSRAATSGSRNCTFTT